MTGVTARVDSKLILEKLGKYEMMIGHLIWVNQPIMLEEVPMSFKL